jgi:hypothetical protein
MIAPITGKLRKRLWLDLSCGLGFGISAAYAYWFVKFFCISRIIHRPHQPQVWYPFEVWLVCRMDPGPSLPSMQFSDILPLVQRQEEFYLKLERQKQIA